MTRKVYLITIEGQDEDPYAFTGLYHEFEEYLEWFRIHNKVAKSKLSFTAVDMAEVEDG